ncbi:MAG: tRNA (5-methylaminomethyl-2-thiouridine)(34)-methyltransferase MnmD [Pseudomonadota bacterium]
MNQAPTPHHVEERDGEPLFSTLFDDHYFSRHDGLAESRHVFLDGNSLPNRLASLTVGTTFRIGELGFGTGLNFLATWALWRALRHQNTALHFTSVEGFPITAIQAAKAHGQWPELEMLSEELIARWQDLPDGVWLDPQTHVRVVVDEARPAMSQFQTEQNAWYLDGFSPAKNPDMWSLPLMQSLARKSAPQATLASYTAAGWVRRNLCDAGFHITKQQGFGTKRDMIVGHLNKADCVSVDGAP